MTEKPGPPQAESSEEKTGGEKTGGKKKEVVTSDAKSVRDRGSKKENSEEPLFLVTASSPHVHGSESVPKIMWTVFVCLLPAAAVGVYRFGMEGAVVLATCTGSAIVFEALIRKLSGKDNTVSDGSAALTGLLLGMNLPAGCPIYVCLVGSLVAVGLAKAVFGGLGHNPFNPALTARIFLVISFPVAMTTWPLTHQQLQNGPPIEYFGSRTTWMDRAGNELEQTSAHVDRVDTVTGATPLPAVKHDHDKGTHAFINYMDLLLGNQPGCIGEVSALALMLGGLVLLLLGYITWHIPLTYLLTVAVIATITQWVDPDRFAGPLFHWFTGGLMIGAFFMATDYVTSPVYTRGKIIFGVALGVLTMLIRLWGGYPEGVSFSILLMNAATPLIDRFTRPKKYGIKRFAQVD